MTAITIPIQAETPQLRPLNILRDLTAVANLIELCFNSMLDTEGQHYVQQMRRASRDNNFLRWATTAVETVSMPLSGYIWEEMGQVVGNVSLIPFRRAGRKIYLIANVAVHPEHRRRGIGRALTIAALHYARQRRTSAIWLHVRPDNPGAVELYRQLGFHERSRRTHWQAKSDRNAAADGPEVTISRRYARDWLEQEMWLKRLYPDELAWYQPMPWTSLRSGLAYSLYRLFLDYETRQWTARADGQLLGVLAWQPVYGRADRLWAAVPPENSVPALTALLCHARRTLTWRPTLALDFPADRAVEAIQAAGFQPRRTLIWMQADETEVVVNRK